MKKIIVVLLVIVLAFGMLFIGCSKDTDKEEDKDAVTETRDAEAKDEKTETNEAKVEEEITEVSILHRWPPETGSNSVFTDMFEAFEAENPNIDLIVESVPNAMYEAQLTVRLASDAAPDVYCLWPGGRVESQVRNGTILDISDVWEENGWFDDFTQNVIGGCTHTDGKIYTFPMNNMTNVFWYNVKIFDEVGATIPTTWDELMETAELIKQAGYTPFALGGNPTRWMPAFWFDYLLLNSAGGEFREALMWGEKSWESPEVYHVFETWKEAIDKGYFNEDYASIDQKQAMGLMASNKAAMALNGPWAIDNFMQEDMGWIPEEDFNMFAFPVVDEGTAPAFEGCIEAWCINAMSEKIDQAKLLLGYLGRSDTVAYYCKTKNILGPRKDTGFDIYADTTRNMMGILSDKTSINPLHQNFELATLPAMQDAGMDAIIEFMTFPETYKEICARVQSVSEETFN